MHKIQQSCYVCFWYCSVGGSLIRELGVQGVWNTHTKNSKKFPKSLANWLLKWNKIKIAYVTHSIVKKKLAVNIVLFILKFKNRFPLSFAFLILPSDLRFTIRVLWFWIFLCLWFTLKCFQTCIWENVGTMVSLLVELRLLSSNVFRRFNRNKKRCINGCILSD